ncbi:hypothetical protein [Thalassospira sp. A3_1]|uniref:hypothetical protein n=1 Tax=Thalassospira sp. A3_1 TaxID=2821088 RepID=UPI001ADAF7C4|nr:hypothetical protein [Thalassospira sp. A3_1]MBO9508774.1 hypothetical protein [Thalassospira sp. A3_1]
MNIGIDRNSGLIYEGKALNGYGAWPTPPLSHAIFIYPGDELTFENTQRAECYFREDTFDPVSRIRRGRFYFAGTKQPEQWFVQPHPTATGELRRTRDGRINKELDTYYGYPIWNRYFSEISRRPQIILGKDDRFTMWNVVDIEAIHTGEDLVTLKASSRFNILPVLQPDQISSNHIKAVNETLNQLADDVYKSSPVSIVDRTREAIAQVLLAYYKATKESAQDLGKLTSKLESDGYIIAASAAKIVARLHARAKPVERQKRDVRPVRQQDSELAVQCLGIILCDLELADWP